MGSKADFYVGRGIEAEWLGSLQWDGMPEGMPREILTSTVEVEYRTEVDSLLTRRGDSIKADAGWPWPWDTSHGTKYAYAFEPLTNSVMASCFGSSWWKASAKEPDHTTLRRKAATFPDMSLTKKGGGVFDADAAPKKKQRKKRKSP